MKWEKCIFETLDSTNKMAKTQEVGAVVIAKSQTDGCGRYGHAWISPMGNLYMSVVMKMYGINTPLMTFVIAVSIVEALTKIGIFTTIKWPNDILLNDKKVAGILLECADDKLIVGIGVNVVSHPTENLPYPATDLNGQVSPEKLSDLILETFDKYIGIFETQGFEPIYCKMKSYLKGIGHSVVVRLPNQQLNGIFKDFSQSGALILQLPDKTEREITAGSVFFI